MKYKPKTVIRGPWPTSDMFTPAQARAADNQLVRARRTRDEVLRFLRHQPTQTVKQIAEALGINKSTVKSAVGALMRMKYIKATLQISNEFRRARHYKVAP